MQYSHINKYIILIIVFPLIINSCKIDSNIGPYDIIWNTPYNEKIEINLNSVNVAKPLSFAPSHIQIQNIVFNHTGWRQLTSQTIYIKLLFYNNNIMKKKSFDIFFNDSLDIQFAIAQINNYLSTTPLNDEAPFNSSFDFCIHTDKDSSYLNCPIKITPIFSEQSFDPDFNISFQSMALIDSVYLSYVNSIQLLSSVNDSVSFTTWENKSSAIISHINDMLIEFIDSLATSKKSLPHIADYMVKISSDILEYKTLIQNMSLTGGFNPIFKSQILLNLYTLYGHIEELRVDWINIMKSICKVTFIMTDNNSFGYISP